MSGNEKDLSIAPIAVEQVAFGVRFQPHYEVLDNTGAVIDLILRSKGSRFGPSTFPLSNREAGGHRLFNPNNSDSLRLTERDAILEMLVDTTNSSTIKDLAEHFNSCVLGSLRDVANLKDISRYGVVFRLKECGSALKETPVNQLIQRDFRDARSLSLRFTRRLPVLEALTRKSVNDYRNVIYTVKQSEDGKVRIGVDYQEYFDPELNAGEWFKKPYVDFVDRGISYFRKEFQEWLKKLTGGHEAT